MRIKHCVLFFFLVPLLAVCEIQFVRGSAFRALAKHTYDEFGKMESGESVQQGDIVFVKTELLDAFVEKIHPTISSAYILITHNSDNPSPGQFEYLLEDPKIAHWFGQNQSMTHPKFTGIPIGIANEIDSWGRPLLHGRSEYLELVAEKICGMDKTRLLYLYFDPYTNREVRLPVRSYFLQQDFCKWARRRPYLAYLSYMADHKFAVSPPGNGLDCHRTWEALYLGVIPIVQRSSMDETLKGLPVLFVDDWSEVNKEMLQAASSGMSLERYSREKLDMEFWKEVIHAHAQACREGLCTPQS